MVMGVRTADLPGKIDEKLKSENMQKKEHYSVLQSAPFRSQIFAIFFTSGGKMLRTFLLIVGTPLQFQHQM